MYVIFVVFNIACFSLCCLNFSIVFLFYFKDQGFPIGPTPLFGQVVENNDQLQVVGMYGDLPKQ